MAKRRRRRNVRKESEREHEKSEEETAVKTEHSRKEKSSAEPTPTIPPFVWKVLPILLILIPILLSVFLRVQPAVLPMTDQWAQDTVEQQFKNRIQQQVDSQYPTLPKSQKQQIVAEQFNAFLANNSGMVRERLKETSAHFKSRMQDENGQTYLLAIDPYFYMRRAQHYVDHGHAGTMILNESTATEAQRLMYPEKNFSGGTVWEHFRMAPVGSGASMGVHTYVVAYFYSFLNIFSDVSFMAAAFYVPLVFATLAVIPAFFIGRKIGGNVGGFFTSVLVAAHPAFLSRTVAGFSDTDAYNVMFPLFMLWLFIEGYEAEGRVKKGVLFGLSGLFTGLFAMTWSGWWYGFNSVIAGLGILFLIEAVKHYKELMKGIKHFFSVPRIRNLVVSGIAFFASSYVFVSLFNASLTKMAGIVTHPLKMLESSKQVGVGTVWPNIQTTVAEMNAASLNKVVEQMGGNLIFFFAVVGLLVLAFRMDENGRFDFKYFTIILVWFLGMLYTSTHGIRFTMLLVPAFAIALGGGLAILYTHIAKWLREGLQIPGYLIKPVLIVLIALLFVSPIQGGFKTAAQEVPSMNDAWYNSLEKIQMESDKDAIINSWWDFGHWFITVANRSATFDGSGQDKYMAHWIGKSLLTSDEDKARGILRMVDCGNRNAYVALDSIMNDSVKSVDILNEIVVLDREAAREHLEQYIPEEKTDFVLKYTHCEPPENYYITSDDMVGKSGVWAHFGSWNFTKAFIYKELKEKKYRNDMDAGVSMMQEKFGYSEDRAQQLYYKARNLNSEGANDWIAPWPSYSGKGGTCTMEGESMSCGNGIEVNLQEKTVSVPTQGGKKHPRKVAFPTEDGIEIWEPEEPWVTLRNGRELGVALIPQGKGRYTMQFMDHKLTGSMFTRLYYYQGHGMKYFDQFSHERQFTGGDIYIWKVDWDGESKRNVFGTQDEQNETTQGGEVHARHILISTEERSDEEALSRAEDIKEMVNESNFAALASEYSEGPSAERGGDLGWFGRGRMAQPFEDAAFSLQTGEVSEPVKTEFGYHIITVVNRSEG